MRRSWAFLVSLAAYDEGKIHALTPGCVSIAEPLVLLCRNHRLQLRALCVLGCLSLSGDNF